MHLEAPLRERVLDLEVVAQVLVRSSEPAEVHALAPEGRHEGDLDEL
jgi:hypothetical protein